MADMKRISADQILPGVLEGQEMIAEQEDMMLAEMAPKGDFKRKPLNALVVVTRKMQPLFGLEGDYPKFDGDLTELPIEFVRVLSMFKKAVDDAIAQDILSEDDSFDIQEISDSSSLTLLAGKLNNVLRNKAFKKFLAEKPEPTEVMEESEVEETAVDSDRTPMPGGSEEMDLDELFMGRM